MSHCPSSTETPPSSLKLLAALALLSSLVSCNALTPSATLPASPTTEPSPSPASTPPTARLHAGLRASSYGISPFPKPEWWRNSTQSMASRFDGAAPAVVWIVGTIKDRYCWLKFPSPASDEKYPKVLFSYQDYYGPYLDLFDRTGVKVWLQVEPGDADVATLIDLVLKQYASHPSVVGFGIDVEWYRRRDNKEGKAVTDEEARAWVERIRSYNPTYRLFLKHWLTEKLPPTYRDGVMFLSDSQGFASLDEMVRDFVEWGQAFAPAPVGFQYGYLADQAWWKTLPDPPGDIGRALLDRIPNATELYWVDFTALGLWPDSAP